MNVLRRKDRLEGSEKTAPSGKSGLRLHLRKKSEKTTEGIQVAVARRAKGRGRPRPMAYTKKAQKPSLQQNEKKDQKSRGKCNLCPED